MPISPRVLLGPLASMDLAMECGIISGGADTVVGMVHLLHSRLLSGTAVDLGVEDFSRMLLGIDMDADDGDAVADALAECERQGVPHRIMRSDPDASDDKEEAYSIIIASSPDVLAFAVREFYALYPNVIWL